MREESGFISLSKLKFQDIITASKGDIFYVGVVGNMTEYVAVSNIHYNSDCDEPDYELNAVRTDSLKNPDDWKTVDDYETIWWGDVYTEDNSCPLCGMNKEINSGVNTTLKLTSEGLTVTHHVMAYTQIGVTSLVKYCPECGHIILYKEEV